MPTITDTTSVELICLDLDKSLDQFDRATARAMRTMLKAAVYHRTHESTMHWSNSLLFERSMKATARTIGICIYIIAREAQMFNKGNEKMLQVIVEGMIQDAASCAIEQVVAEQRNAELRSMSKISTKQ